MVCIKYIYQVQEWMKDFAHINNYGQQLDFYGVMSFKEHNSIHFFLEKTDFFVSLHKNSNMHIMYVVA